LVLGRLQTNFAVLTSHVSAQLGSRAMPTCPGNRKFSRARGKTKRPPVSIVPPAQPRRPISKRRWRRRAGPRWLVRRAPHQAISLIRSDLSFGANSLPEDLPFGPPVSEARTARPAWANHSPDTQIRQGAAARLVAICEGPYPLRQTVESHHCLWRGSPGGR
jgi:hypothetical protein